MKVWYLEVQAVNTLVYGAKTSISQDIMHSGLRVGQLVYGAKTSISQDIMHSGLRVGQIWPGSTRAMVGHAGKKPSFPSLHTCFPGHQTQFLTDLRE
jgi:hypothetical protein